MTEHQLLMQLLDRMESLMSATEKRTDASSISRYTVASITRAYIRARTTDDREESELSYNKDGIPWDEAEKTALEQARQDFFAKEDV